MEVSTFNAIQGTTYYNTSQRVDCSDNNISVLTCYFYHLTNRAINVPNGPVYAMLYGSYFENCTLASSSGAAIFYSGSQSVHMKRLFGTSNNIQGLNSGHFSYTSPSDPNQIVEISDVVVSNSSGSHGYGHISHYSSKCRIKNVNLTKLGAYADSGIAIHDSENTNISYAILNEIYATDHAILTYLNSTGDISFININNCFHSRTDVGLVFAYSHSSFTISFSSFRNINDLICAHADLNSYIKATHCYIPKTKGNVSQYQMLSYYSPASFKVYNLIYNYDIIRLTCKMASTKIGFVFNFVVFILIIE